jgi:hypothetical protein
MNKRPLAGARQPDPDDQCGRFPAIDLTRIHPFQTLAQWQCSTEIDTAPAVEGEWSRNYFPFCFFRFA